LDIVEWGNIMEITALNVLLARMLLCAEVFGLIHHFDIRHLEKNYCCLKNYYCDSIHHADMICLHLTFNK